MKNITKINSIRMAHHFKKDSIDISFVEKPYGEYSDSVVRMEILDNERVKANIYVPFENIDDIIESLQKVKDKFDTNSTMEELHEELSADVGGGQ